jgi:hypothetical protein
MVSMSSSSSFFVVLNNRLIVAALDGDPAGDLNRACASGQRHPALPASRYSKYAAKAGGRCRCEQAVTFGKSLANNPVPSRKSPHHTSPVVCRSG